MVCNFIFDCVTVKTENSCTVGDRIQLFPERLSGKNVHATIPKGNMGHDQYSVPDTVAVETTFVALL